MAKKISLKKALLMSGLSMAVCSAMLVGTTFAWFSSTAESGVNKIVAGNLKVELQHKVGEDWKDASNVKLFDTENVLWEPGMMVVSEAFRVANVGSLALKYSISVNMEDKVKAANHGLSEVIQYKVVAAEELPESLTDDDRADVWASEDKAGQLSGVLYAAGTEDEDSETDALAVVLYWEPTDHDNDYNVESGAAQLETEFSINVRATQTSFEEDSFGPDYDANLEVSPEGYVLEKDEETGLVFTNVEEGRMLYDASEAVVTEGKVTVPDGVEIIGSHAFVFADDVKEVELPDSVWKIEDRAFYNQPGDSSITTVIETINLENVKVIGERAFRATNLTEVDLSSAEVIGEGAFQQCEGITSVALPNIKELGKNAFYESGLTEITLGDELESIGENALRNTSITEIEIPASVKSIGNYAFRDCHKLEKVTFMHDTADLEIGTGVFLVSGTPIPTMQISVKNETVKEYLSSKISGSYITISVIAD